MDELPKNNTALRVVCICVYVYICICVGMDPTQVHNLDWIDIGHDVGASVLEPHLA